MNENNNVLQITPDTKLAALLDAYPNLEPILIEVAPAFKRLRNPFLRNTVAKIANLRQVAEVGEVSLGKLITTLRNEVGLEPLSDVEMGVRVDDDAPDWFSADKIVMSLDAREMIERNEHPVGRVLKELDGLGADGIYELITQFKPAPLVDKAMEKGFRAWTVEPEPELVKTYFRRG